MNVVSVTTLHAAVVRTWRNPKRHATTGEQDRRLHMPFATPLAQAAHMRDTAHGAIPPTGFPIHRNATRLAMGVTVA